MGLVPDKRPKLSIIIVSFNCRQLLLECLASVEADQLANAYEVIVVDNASTDGTAEAVAEGFPSAVLLRSETNRGFSAANNEGIEVAAGEHLLLLNPDTRVMQGALSAAVAELDARPDVGMLGVKLVQEDGRLDHAAKRGFPTPLSALAYFLRLSRIFPNSQLATRYTAGHVAEDEIAFVDAVNGAFMLVRREAVTDVGLLDEAYWLYMEDLDWCHRFWDSGWKVLYWPRVSVVHRKGGSSGTSRAWKTNRAFHDGMWRFYKKFRRSDASPIEAAAVFLGIYGRFLCSATVSSIRRARTSIS
jgi:GT2 family glycosyltransferase